MAETNVQITAGSGTAIDAFQPGGSGPLRQAMVLGDPNLAANVAGVSSDGHLLTEVIGQPLTTPAATAITAAAATYTVTATIAGNVTFWLAGSNSATGAAVTVASVVFEQTADGYNWAPLPVVRSDTSAAVTSFAGTIAASAAIAFDAALEGVYQARVRTVTAATSGALYCYGVMGGLLAEPLVSAVPGSALVKGTQSAQGFSVQDLKDSGRNPFTFSVIEAAGVTTESLFSGQYYRGSTASSSGQTNVAVASGKTMRLQQFIVAVKSGATTATWSRIVLRSSFTTSATTASSPVIAAVEIGPSAQVSGIVDRFAIDIPDGVELASGFTFGVTHISSATTNLDSFSLIGYEY